MNKVVKFNEDTHGLRKVCKESSRDYTDLTEATEEILMNVQANNSITKELSVPISEIAMLGAGVSSLIPSLRTVTQTTTINTQGLYELVNVGIGDSLKRAKDGTAWGSVKTASGKSKMLKIKEAGPLTATSTAEMAINPAIILMAVALFTVEQQLKGIEKTQKQILSALEVEKQSDIEADVETLYKIITTYKHCWDNETVVKNNHKLTLDIQKNERKNMNGYKKKIVSLLQYKPSIKDKAKEVKRDNTMLGELQNLFQYYRLSVYAFAMASFAEVMLGGNYQEAYIDDIKSEVEKYSLEYREMFSKCSVFIEKQENASVEVNVLKGIGNASNAVGKFIGSIPVVKEGPVDEFLQDKGRKLKKNANVIKRSKLEMFATFSNPGTGVFIEKMQDMIQIYNHTDKICCDDKKIYLIAG